jgi:predicted 3-demethylubiquinone-9 3-methyltransferase (glyoxalase superfamily)
MQKITPCLWCDSNVEEQVNFYVGVFGDRSKILNVSRYGEGQHRPRGEAMMIEFELDGQRFQALNGGGGFPYTQAVSFSIRCDGQKEVDHFWNALLEGGGQEQPCAWLKDRYGLSWQVVPKQLVDYLGHADRAAAGRAMQAMFKMTKIVIADLEKAAAG